MHVGGSTVEHALFGSSFLSPWLPVLLAPSSRARTDYTITCAPRRRPIRTPGGRRICRSVGPSSLRRYVSAHFPKLALMPLMLVVVRLSLLNNP